MAQITHCGHPRRTDNYWLVPATEEDRSKYKYQILLTANCPNCRNFVMEWMPVFLDWKRGPRHRIKLKDHDAWINRTDPVKGDLADIDTSRWKSVKAGVHRVMTSLKEFPYSQYEVRV